MNSAVNGAGRGRGWQRLPRTLVRSYVVPTHAPSAKDTSVTTHCHAATAQLTREYQSDHRRYVLTPATTYAVHPICAGHHPLDTHFHIRNTNAIAIKTCATTPVQLRRRMRLRIEPAVGDASITVASLQHVEQRWRNHERPTAWLPHKPDLGQWRRSPRPLHHRDVTSVASRLVRQGRRS